MLAIGHRAFRYKCTDCSSHKDVVLLPIVNWSSHSIIVRTVYVQMFFFYQYHRQFCEQSFSTAIRAKHKTHIVIFVPCGSYPIIFSFSSLWSNSTRVYYLEILSAGYRQWNFTEL